MNEEFKQLQEENNNIRADIDTILGKLTQKDREAILTLIELLIENEQNQEKECNQ